MQTRTTHEVQTEIVSLIKPHVNLSILREVLILMNEYDTAARSDIVSYARQNGYTNARPRELDYEAARSLERHIDEFPQMEKL